jgi:glycyl-tRNA synthetase
MFQTHMGPVADEGSVVYLRPETAQGIFVNFENVQATQRLKVPFGIAQIGKSFRNEITPGNFIFRTREFEQMEMQYFVEPGKDSEFYQEWKETRLQFYKDIGLNMDNIRFHPHGEGELAHYAKEAGDYEYNLPIGWQELEGIHNRGDFDLTQHQNLSGKKLEYFDQALNKKYIPFVIETAIGCDRLALTVLCDAYREEITEKDGKKDSRIVFGFHPSVAPVQVAVLPLSKKPELQEVCFKLDDDLRKEAYKVQYDESQSIGKRYRRQDEIGTPFCVTVDFDTLDDKAVTVRHRDTMEQDRISIDKLPEYLKEKLNKFN